MQKKIKAFFNMIGEFKKLFWIVVIISILVSLSESLGVTSMLPILENIMGEKNENPIGKIFVFLARLLSFDNKTIGLSVIFLFFMSHRLTQLTL